MKRYDISPSTVRSTLKHLLKTYEKNWKYIEEDDYKVLLDAIVEPEGPKEMGIVEHGFEFIDEPEEEEEEEEPLKRRPRLRSETTSSNPAGYLRENRGNLCLEYINTDTKANKNENEDVPLSQCSSEVDIASSSNGEVKFTFSICKPPPGFGFPSPDAVTNRVEDIYQEKIQGSRTRFSLAQVLKHICECFIEQGNASDHAGNMNPSFNNEPKNEDAPTVDFPRFVVASEFKHCFSGMLKKQRMFGIDELSCSSSLTTIPKEQSKHYSGLEKREISLVNDVDDEKPPTFTFIKTNVNYDTANVKPVLVSISDENSCPGCFGDCLSHEVPCTCAVENGGEFAYTTDGVVDEKFLEKRIDITLQKRMKFIKECWYKCGCGLICGNRVVQRGIHARLQVSCEISRNVSFLVLMQVFKTREGKGWGLRTLENLPRGTFVCEYVGEIITNRELFERNKHDKNEEHRYSVLLDADWSSKGFLKDEHALCLDAASFGNAARFINHRCVDANMVEIPVEVESPDHHFYHHAFFTTREVKAMEELTWDYGIDFDDDSYARRAFRCKCGSEYCKAVKRYKRSRRGVAGGKEVIARVN